MAANAGRGYVDGGDAATSTNYTYTDNAVACDADGFVTTIKANIAANNDILRIGCGSLVGTTFTPRHVVDIDITGDGTGQKTYTAPADFTAFQMIAGDFIMTFSDGSTSTIDRSSTGSPLGYGYNDIGDDTEAASFTVTLSTSRVLEFEFEGVVAIDSYVLSGFTKDKNGDALSACTCNLFKLNAGEDDADFIAVSASDSDGYYIFEELNDDDAKYFVVSWRDDVPHVFDATDHVLVPLIEG